MTTCKTVFFNWNDLVALAYREAGLTSDEEIRCKGEALFTPDCLDLHRHKFLVEIRVHDQTFDERVDAGAARCPGESNVLISNPQDG